MPNIIPKVELLVDLTNPVEEMKACISVIVNAQHPEKRLEVLQGIDLWVGEATARLEQELQSSQSKDTNIEERG